jgi:hypothetical protein
LDNVRKQIKFEVFEGRRAPGQRYCVCELCKKNPATDLHEIVNRAHAPVELVQRHPELLSALCNSCNLGKSDNPQARMILLRANAARYGTWAVQQALDTVQASVKVKLYQFYELMTILASEKIYI